MIEGGNTAEIWEKCAPAGSKGIEDQGTQVYLRIEQGYCDWICTYWEKNGRYHVGEVSRGQFL